MKINVIQLSLLAVARAWCNFSEARPNKEKIRSRSTETLTLLIMHESRGNRILVHAKRRPVLRENKSFSTPSTEFYFRITCRYRASVSKFRIMYRTVSASHQTFMIAKRKKLGVERTNII